MTIRISCRPLPPTSNTGHLTPRTRLCSDSKISPPREGWRPLARIAVPVAPTRHEAGCVSRRLGQLPNLHAIPRQYRNQQAIPLRVVADIGGTRDAADQSHLLPRFVARHAGIGPAR